MSRVPLVLLLLVTGCAGSAASDAGGDAPIDCAPQDASRVGDCDIVHGAVWLGGTCQPVIGCSCQGEDCDALYPDVTACLEAHRACTRACASHFISGCLSGEWCDYALEDHCGNFDAVGLCRPNPTACPEPGGVPVCGCNGTEYANECLANLAGIDAARLGGCL